jgi:hypothetical protein
VAVALARPLGAFVDSPREAVVRYVRGPHTTVRDVGLGAAIRAGAWIFAGVIFLGLAAVAAAIEDITNASGVISGLVGPPMVVCLLTGVFSAIRAGIAWFVSEERWERAGRILRWTVTPGNRDVIVAVLLVAAGLLIARA